MRNTLLARRARASFPTIGLASLAGSLACGMTLLVGFRLLFMRWINPYSRAGDVSTYPKSILDYSLIFLAWSALYFGIKHWRDLQTERQRLETALRRLDDRSNLDRPAPDSEVTPLAPGDHVLLTTGDHSFFLKVGS